MKKSLPIFLLFIGFVQAEGPVFRHKDTYINQEFENAYQDLRSLVNKVFNGTITNDSPPAGFKGEWKNSDITTAQNFPASGVWGDLTSISLTAGDWDIGGLVFAQSNGATVTICEMGISQTSGNNAPSRGPLAFGFAPPTATYATSGAVPDYRFSLASTTTVYLKYYAEYTVATPKAFGTIHARRVR